MTAKSNKGLRRIIQVTFSGLIAAALVAASFISATSASATSSGPANAVVWVTFDNAAQANFIDSLNAGGLSSTPNGHTYLSGPGTAVNVTSDGNWLYYADNFTPQGHPSGIYLVRTDLQGMNARAVAALSSPDVALSVSGGRLYWAEQGASTISYKPLWATGLTDPTYDIGQLNSLVRSVGDFVIVDDWAFVYDNRQYRSIVRFDLRQTQPDTSAVTIRLASGIGNQGEDLVLATDGTQLAISEGSSTPIFFVPLTSVTVSAPGGLLDFSSQTWNNVILPQQFGTTKGTIAFRNGYMYVSISGAIVELAPGAFNPNAADGLNGFVALAGLNAASGYMPQSTHGLTTIPPVFTVTFDANNGTGSLPAQKAAWTEPLKQNAGAITRAGYTFSGWNTAANGSGTTYADGAPFNFGQNSTLYAQWTPNAPSAQQLINLSFDAGNSTAVTNIALPAGSSLVLPIPARRSGFEFLGWTLDPTSNLIVGSTVQTGSSDKRFYAVWQPIATTLVVYSDSTAKPVEVTVGDKRALPTPPLRPGYQFKGWFTKARGGYQLSAPLPEQYVGKIEIFAQWMPTPSLTLSGFAAGSPKLTREIANRITRFLARNPGAVSISCVGYTEGPNVLRVDAALSLARARAACDFARKSLGARVKVSGVSGVTLSEKSAKNRKVSISLNSR